MPSTGYRFISGATTVDQELNERFSASFVGENNICPGHMSLEAAISVDTIYVFRSAMISAGPELMVVVTSRMIIGNSFFGRDVALINSFAFGTEFKM